MACASHACDPGVDTWKQSKSSTWSAGTQCYVFKTIKENLTWLGLYPCDLEDHLPLQRLGIFLWDVWRLNAMGLCNTLTRTNIKAPDGSPYVPVPARIQNKATQEWWLWLIQLSLPDNEVAEGEIEH